MDPDIGSSRPSAVQRRVTFALVPLNVAGEPFGVAGASSLSNSTFFEGEKKLKPSTMVKYLKYVENERKCAMR